MGAPNRHGGCLCGAVRYSVGTILRNVVCCHCTMCQKTHGIFGPYIKVLKNSLRLTKKDGLRWYDSSALARRGFCGSCGSSLFWEAHQADGVAVAVGTLDNATGLKIVAHIFVADKLECVRLGGGMLQFSGSSHGQIPEACEG